MLVLQGFVELSDVVKSGGIYSIRNAFATRLQQKYLKNIGHFSVIGTGECPFSGDEENAHRIIIG